ncbi:hypothetical protein EC973_006477 [Apophysomyces ossiformis]|uniref:Uncharacterized protein n=1 Tax=Apophysomyces ossiformis TaxID=679940 RepID=A0A8H7ERQ3_9FUNG|nr:hypothetical protein EC973_006477 [Apophysomyces ossiformis]
MVYGISGTSTSSWNDTEREKSSNAFIGSDDFQLDRTEWLRKSIREQKILLDALEGNNQAEHSSLDDLKSRIRAISRQLKGHGSSSSTIGPGSQQRSSPQLWTRYKLNLQSLEDIADQSRTFKKEVDYILNTGVKSTYSKLLAETARLNQSQIELARLRTGNASFRPYVQTLNTRPNYSTDNDNEIIDEVDRECKQRLSEIDQKMSHIDQIEKELRMIMEQELSWIDGEIEHGRKELRDRQMFEQGLFVSDTLARFIDLLDAPDNDINLSHGRFDSPSRSASAPMLSAPTINISKDVCAPPPIPTSQRPGSPRSAADIKAEAQRRIDERRKLFINKYSQHASNDIKRSASSENNDISEDERVAQEKLRRAEAEARERLVTMREKRLLMRQQEMQAEEKRKRAAAEAAAAAEAEMLEEKRRKQIEGDERQERIRKAEAELAERLRQKRQEQLEQLEKEKEEEEKRERELARKKEEEEILAEKNRQHRARLAAEKAARERRLRQEEIERQQREIEEARRKEEIRRQEWQAAEDRKREALEREKEEKEREEAAKVEEDQRKQREEAARIQEEQHRKQREDETRNRIFRAEGAISLNEQAETDGSVSSGFKNDEATAGTSGYGVDIEDEVDFCTIYRVKTLYEYRGIREDDLSFSEDEIIKAHPSKDSSSDWWYGTSLSTNLVGFFPRTYVEVIEEAFRVRTLYEFKKTREDDLGFGENEIIVVQPFQDEDSDWWYGCNEDTYEYGYFPKSYAKIIEAGSARVDRDSAGTKHAVTDGSSPMWITPSARSTSESNLLAVSDTDLPRGLSAPNTPVMKKTTLGMNKIELNRRRRAASNASTGTIGTPNLVLSHPRPESPALTTWSSTMDEHELSAIPPEERTRQEAIYELISSERTYLRDLQMIVNIFYVDSGKYLSQKEQDVIFANVDDLLLCNTALLSDLEARQRETANVVDNIGDIFLKHAESLKCYSLYCRNQSFASRFLQRKREEDQWFEVFLKTAQTRPECRSLDLSHFLLEPMQRITRYPLLLRQILKSTPKKHPDYGLVRSALAGAERVLDDVNEETRRYENRQKMNELSRILDMGNHGRLDVRGREFVMEGVLFKTKSGRKLHGYLFNDTLILAEALKGLSPEGYLYKLYREPMNIEDVSIRQQQTMTLKSSFGNNSGILQYYMGIYGA